MSLRIFLFTLFLVVFSTTRVFAQSSYVLPYPSAMPGSAFYKIAEIKDYLSHFLHYGDFGKFYYNLKQSDKYLVEAKTLFDYKQYLLGYRALKKSDHYFTKVLPALRSASSHKKDISDKLLTKNSASQKHVEELRKMKIMVPESFNWVPEKQKSEKLNLWEAMDKSILIREQ